MSLILTGIDMPNKIDLDFHDNHIVLGGVLYPIDIDQLVYIPTPHGRLIDADKLRDEFSRTESGYCGGWEFCDKPEDFQFLIDDEPTILEAET